VLRVRLTEGMLTQWKQTTICLDAAWSTFRNRGFTAKWRSTSVHCCHATEVINVQIRLSALMQGGLKGGRAKLARNTQVALRIGDGQSSSAGPIIAYFVEPKRTRSF